MSTATNLTHHKNPARVLVLGQLEANEIIYGLDGAIHLLEEQISHARERLRDTGKAVFSEDANRYANQRTALVNLLFALTD